jgi:hypothetical protein
MKLASDMSYVSYANRCLYIFLKGYGALILQFEDKWIPRILSNFRDFDFFGVWEFRGRSQMAIKNSKIGPNGDQAIKSGTFFTTATNKTKS